MTTRYRVMQLSGWGVTPGAWTEFTDVDLPATALAPRLNDPQLYVEVFRNGDWRPASIRELPLWEHAATLEIVAVESQANQLRRNAGTSYRQQGELLEAALQALKAAEDRLREQRVRVEAAEERMKSDIANAKKLETEAAKKRGHLDKRLAIHDAATSPAEAVTA